MSQQLPPWTSITGDLYLGIAGLVFADVEGSFGSQELWEFFGFDGGWIPKNQSMNCKRSFAKKESPTDFFFSFEVRRVFFFTCEKWDDKLNGPCFIPSIDLPRLV